MRRTMTPRGQRALRDALQRLKAMRPELADAIEVARQHGDLSENADYDAAKEKSGITEAKIRDVEARLSQAEVIDPRSINSPARVTFGVTVTVEDIDSGEEKKYSIFGVEDSDVSKGWISYETPLARGLLGKSVGDTATIKLPGGIRELEIMEIVVDYNDEEKIVLSI